MLIIINLVSVNFASFLLAYSCLLIAFALAFSVLFSNFPVFRLPASVIKVVMMMTGELEFEDTLYADSPLNYPLTAHGMFLIFALLITMILTNLLIGLAVSDIQASNFSLYGFFKRKDTSVLVLHVKCQRCFRHFFDYHLTCNKLLHVKFANKLLQWYCSSNDFKIMGLLLFPTIIVS